MKKEIGPQTLLTMTGNRFRFKISLYIELYVSNIAVLKKKLKQAAQCNRKRLPVLYYLQEGQYLPKCIMY